MKLYAKPASFRAQKVIVAAQYANLDLEIVTDAKPEQLKSKGPINKLPLLETDKGTIAESNAIARYIANVRPESGINGVSPMEKAQIDSWIDFCSNEIEVPASVWVYPIIGWMDLHDQAYSKAQKDLKAAIMLLESHLKMRTFLVGRDVTLADIAIACALVLPFKLVLDEKSRKPFPCVTRWFLTCVNQPEFLAVLGEVTLAKKALVPSGASASSAAPAKQEKKKKEKPAAAPAPAPAQAAKADSQPPEEPKPEKKQKNPLDLLPKSEFVLDAWKKQYSNAPGGDCYQAMPWFWEKYDPQGYCLYHCKYMYNDELKVTFMTSNLAGGFIQRCDEIRKYAFGTLQIIGQDGGPMEIVGAWLFRGDSHKLILEANPDSESYEWTKIDDLNETNKKLIEDMWCAWETIDGKPILDCKVFK